MYAAENGLRSGGSAFFPLIAGRMAESRAVAEVRVAGVSTLFLKLCSRAPSESSHSSAWGTPATPSFSRLEIS